jgi:hypothetical protein
MGKWEEIPKTNPAEIEAVIARVKQSNIEQRDVELIERLLRTVLVLVKLLERKNISIKKLSERGLSARRYDNGRQRIESSWKTGRSRAVI